MKKLKLCHCSWNLSHDLRNWLMSNTRIHKAFVDSPLYVTTSFLAAVASSVAVITHVHCLMRDPLAFHVLLRYPRINLATAPPSSCELSFHFVISHTFIIHMSCQPSFNCHTFVTTSAISAAIIYLCCPDNLCGVGVWYRTPLWCPVCQPCHCCPVCQLLSVPFCPSVCRSAIICFALVYFVVGRSKRAVL